MEGPLALRLIAVLFLVALNAYFVAAEFVLVAARPTRLRQLVEGGHSAARVALRLHDNLEQVLSATQLGITLASLALGWIGENAVADMIMPALATLSPATQSAIGHSIAAAVAFLIITTLHVVLGEVVPKNVALGKASERLALLIAPPLDVFMQATRPLLHVLNAMATAISRLFGARNVSHRNIHSPEELKMLVSAGIESGVLPESIEGMMHALFDLDKILVREVMVPRPDIVSVAMDTPFEKLLRIFAKHQHSRLPVFDSSPDNFIGEIHMKDLFRAWVQRHHIQKSGFEPRPFNLRGYLRELMIVPETKPLDQLLEEFRARRRHQALVVDEFGTIAGLVTVIDVLQRVMGVFAEPHDREEAPEPVELSGAVVDGSTHIRDIDEPYNIEFPRDGFETVAGFVMKALGRIPKEGDSVVYQGWRFTVQEMDKHRVATVRIDRESAQPAASGEVKAS